MKSRSKGYTLVEMGIALTVIAVIAFLIFFGLASKLFLNRPGQTEERAYIALANWQAKNDLAFTRKTCAPDTDRDGYGSCTVVTTEGEKIYLECSSTWWMHVTGSTGCKEVETTVKMRGIPKTVINNSSSSGGSTASSSATVAPR